MHAPAGGKVWDWLMAEKGFSWARMSTRVKEVVHRTLRRFGVDLIRWRPQSSSGAALAKMLTLHRIDTVLDVGANEGQYALFLRKLGYEGRIISFDPLTATHQQLQRLAAHDASWTVAPRMAIGDQEGEVRINVASNNGASSSILRMLEAHERAAPKVRYVGSEVVPMSRLDRVAARFLGQAENVFLKVDVQGYEYQVLQGCRTLFPRIAGVQLELSLVPLYEGQALFSGLSDYMRQQGFDIWGILPGLVDNSSGRLLQTDVVFFRV